MSEATRARSGSSGRRGESPAGPSSRTTDRSSCTPIRPTRANWQQDAALWELAGLVWRRYDNTRLKDGTYPNWIWSTDLEVRALVPEWALQNPSALQSLSWLINEFLRHIDDADSRGWNCRPPAAGGRGDEEGGGNGGGGGGDGSSFAQPIMINARPW